MSDPVRGDCKPSLDDKRLSDVSVEAETVSLKKRSVL